jgi:hypothetical protein
MPYIKGLISGLLLSAAITTATHFYTRKSSALQDHNSVRLWEPDRSTLEDLQVALRLLRCCVSYDYQH